MQFISFQAKYATLSAAILLVAFLVYKLWNKERRQEAINNVKTVFPAMIFFVVTFCVFMPNSLFLGNIKEFFLPYRNAFGVILLVACLSAAGILTAAIIIPKMSRGGAQRYAALLFGITICMYIQGNFLNAKLPELNGAQIDWTGYRIPAIISMCFWIVTLIACQILLSLGNLKKLSVLEKLHIKNMQCVFDYVAYFLTVVQLVTLVVLVLTTNRSMTTTVALTKEDEFSVGTDNNIIVFILDAFESEKFEETVIADKQYESSLEDFTFYRNAVSGGAYTKAALPLLLTGIEYEPAWMTHDEYLVEAWTTTQLYDDLEKEGFDVRIFTSPTYITHVTEGMIDNAKTIGKNYNISGRYEFAKDLYRFTAFYAMPHYIKQLFWFYNDDTFHVMQAPVSDEKLAADSQSVENADYYGFDDVQYYEDFKVSGLEVKYKNAFRLYHLLGAHPPFTMNEAIERVSEEETSQESQIQGVMKIVFSYIEELKTAGLYDRSTIIITADHGSEGLEQNPAFLIKEAKENHPFAINEAPIHFRNVAAAIARAAMEDYAAYGASVYDIDENSDVERLHTVKDAIAKRGFPDLEYPRLYGRFIIPPDARNADAIAYHDVYNINRFAYQLGDIISFAGSNRYAESINYRLYQEDGVGIASNELTLCFDLEDYKRGNLEFSFWYRSVYNDAQKIRLYANGQKIADMLCTAEEIGQEKKAAIPAGCIKDDVLVLRMVFPNAVTPHQLDKTNPDTRVLSVAFESMKLQ